MIVLDQIRACITTAINTISRLIESRLS